jgi:hypothetical protein
MRIFLTSQPSLQERVEELGDIVQLGISGTANSTDIRNYINNQLDLKTGLSNSLILNLRKELGAGIEEM